MNKHSTWQVCAALALALAGSSLAVAEPPHHGGPPPHGAPHGGGAHFVPRPPRPGYTHYDVHFGHNQFYPARGYAVRSLPPGAFAVNRFHDRFFFSGGIWYAPRGPSFVVVAPPIGAFVPVLPPSYTTVWVGGLPYYYANDTYYEYDDAQHGYQVVDPPAGSDEEAAAAADGAPPDDGSGAPQDAGYAPPPPPSGYAPPPPPSGGAAGGIGGGMFIYPVNGQSEQQQSQDKWECHKWAVGQSGFDPTSASDPSRRGSYNRAIQACLQGRGYSVK